MIASGARADLVIVDGHPLREMGRLRDRRTLQAAIVESGVFHKNQHGAAHEARTAAPGWKTAPPGSTEHG